jgi:hypothetical protein
MLLTKPVAFDYGRRRTGWRVPRWLLLLLGGCLAGVGGVFYAQERVLPPRLTRDASAHLQSAFESAEAERTRLAAELAQATRRLEAALAEKKTLSADLAGSRTAVERLRDDLAAEVTALPPDPRGGAVEVRAARFAASGGMLAYDVVLTRSGSSSARPLAAVLQLVVTGASAQRPEASVALKPIALSMGPHEVLRGSLPLPDGFRPHQTTVQVLDKAAGKVLGTRLLVVR